MKNEGGARVVGGGFCDGDAGWMNAPSVPHCCQVRRLRIASPASSSGVRFLPLHPPSTTTDCVHGQSYATCTPPPHSGCLSSAQKLEVLENQSAIFSTRVRGGDLEPDRLRHGTQVDGQVRRIGHLHDGSGCE